MPISTWRGLLVAAALTAPALASAQTLGPLTLISSGTPFSTCTADQPSSQPGTLFPRSAIEPWIAVDPTTGGHLLTGVQQDRWSNGGSRGLRSGVSFDGGASWAGSLPRGVSLCTGGPFQRSTDPWTAFGLDGTAYFFSLAFNNNPIPAINGRSALLVSVSRDGGRSFERPITLIDDTDPLAFNDKNSISTDPTIAGNVYAVWDRLYGPPIAFRAPYGSDEHGGQAAPSALVNDGVAMARERALALRKSAASGAGAAAVATYFFGPAYYARSSDSGRSWTRATPIYDPGRNAQTIGNIVVGLPGGDLLDFFTLIDNRGNASIAYIRSTDHGYSFVPRPQLVSPLSLIAATTPNAKQPLRDSSLLFSVSVDQASGRIYLLRQDVVGASAIVGAVFMQSSDGGLSWTRPVIVSKTPQGNANPLRDQAFNTTIVAAGNGMVVATYYDFRNDPARPGKDFADAWVAYCNPGASGTACANPANWGHEQRLTAGSFNILNAPLTGSGYFLGDYFGLAAQGRDVWPAFTAVTGPGRTALFTRRITFPSLVAAAE